MYAIRNDVSRMHTMQKGGSSMHTIKKREYNAYNKKDNRTMPKIKIQMSTKILKGKK